jgi:type 1 glutamine amidotransferase/HEAT repeat protein
MSCRGIGIHIRNALKAVGLALWMILSLTAGPAEAARKPAGIRVLILSGLNNHDWRSTTPVLLKMFKSSDRFTVVDVSEQPGKLTARDFRKYDVIVSNWTPYPDTARQWPAETEKAFLDYVHNGGGYVVFHAASCTFQVWPEFQQIVAMTWKANYTAHGTYHTFKVEIEDKDHPITHGMPDFYTTDELYHNMVQMVGGKLNVAARAFSAKEERGTGKYEPVVVWTQVGKGRGVNTVLGHDVKAMQEGFRVLLLRSAEWAATGKVTIPIPSDWPTTANMAIAETIDADAAFKAIANYASGQDAKTTNDIEQLVIAAASRTDAGAAAARDELATRIADTLASDATPAAKIFLCRQILPFASEKHVPVLASLLVAQPGTPGAEVADAARGVLEVIPGPAADEALLDALSKTSGSVKLGIIESLGFRRTSRATGALIPLLGSSDTTMAEAVAAALGNNCGSDAENELGKALSTAQGSLRRSVADAYLRCGDRRLGAGELVPATAIYSRLYVSSEAVPIREAALRGLVLSNPEKGIPLATEELGSDQVGLQRTALQLVRTLPGNTGTSVITEQLTKAVPAVQVFLLDALAERGDTSALPAIERAAESDNELVRVAAVRALGALGNKAQVKSLAAQELTQHPQYTWQETDSSIALLNHGRIVWQFNYGKDTRKPYFHPVALLDGPVLTCLSPRDHPWHRALWFSWKMLNGVNYWEEDPKTGFPEGRTEVVHAEIVTNKDYSAAIHLTLTYHLPDGPMLLAEDRTINVSTPDRDGRYRIDWRGTFAAGDQDVLLQGGTAGGGYAGMSVRISQTTGNWRLIDSEGRVDLPGGPVAKNTHGQKARWMDFSVVDTATGETGGIAILQHPSSFRYPTHWHNIMDDKFPFGYFSPAPLWAEPYTLQAGKTLMVSYRVVVHPGRGSKDQLDAEWTAFSESKE